MRLRKQQLKTQEIYLSFKVVNKQNRCERASCAIKGRRSQNQRVPTNEYADKTKKLVVDKYN